MKKNKEIENRLMILWILLTFIFNILNYFLIRYVYCERNFLPHVLAYLNPCNASYSNFIGGYIIIFGLLSAIIVFLMYLIFRKKWKRN